MTKGDTIGFKEIYIWVENYFSRFLFFCVGKIFSKKFSVTFFLCSSFPVIVFALHHKLYRLGFYGGGLPRTILFLLLFAVISASLWFISGYQNQIQAWGEKFGKWVIRVVVVVAAVLLLGQAVGLCYQKVMVRMAVDEYCSRPGKNVFDDILCEDSDKYKNNYLIRDALRYSGHHH